jgi:hypothetical protein
MLAGTIKAFIDAGLALAGYEDGEYHWVGDKSQWDEAQRLEAKYLENGYGS